LSVHGQPVAFTFIGGKLVTNQETLGAVSSKTWTVPSGKRWVILGGYAERDQSATFRVSITDASDKNLMLTELLGAATTDISFGGLNNLPWTTGLNPMQFPFPVDAGMKIVYTYGAAQTTPEVALLVLEIQI